MRKILEELWRGNLTPQIKCFNRGTAYENSLERLCKNEANLNSILDEKSKELFEKFRDCRDEIADYTEEESFINGFRLGARIVMESFYENDGFFYEPRE